MASSKVFSNAEVVAYYDQTEVHYRYFWQLEKSMGLHYGLWERGIRSLPAAVVHTNRRLAQLGQITAQDRILDAGCGVGGSAIFLAKNYGAAVLGITLSAKQVARAQGFAQTHGVADRAQFQVADYTATGLPAAAFSVVWAIESMETAPDKRAFLAEAWRLLAPGGRLLVGDVFKTQPFDLAQEPSMQTMLHGWAMSDALSLAEWRTLTQEAGFTWTASADVTAGIWPSARRMYWAGWIGMVGSGLYQLYRKTGHFSRQHHRTGIAQYRALRRGLWQYHLVALTKVP